MSERTSCKSFHIGHYPGCNCLLLLFESYIRRYAKVPCLCGFVSYVLSVIRGYAKLQVWQSWLCLIFCQSYTSLRETSSFYCKLSLLRHRRSGSNATPRPLLSQLPQHRKIRNVLFSSDTTSNDTLFL